MIEPAEMQLGLEGDQLVEIDVSQLVGHGHVSNHPVRTHPHGGSAEEAQSGARLHW